MVVIDTRTRSVKFTFARGRLHISFWGYRPFRWFGDLEGKRRGCRESRQGCSKIIVPPRGALTVVSQVALSAGYRHIDCAWEYGVHPNNIDHNPGGPSHPCS